MMSWIVNIVLAFVLIKFIIYPGLGFLLGTGFPVVAVVSGSMEHDGSFNNWWESGAICSTNQCTQEKWYIEHGITKEKFRKFIFKNGFNTGDIMVLLGTKPKNIDVGDVIVFKSTKPYPIIHRVIEVEDSKKAFIFETKGDHNPAQGNYDKNISEERLLGRAVFRIPYLGWIKILFFKLVYWIGGIIGIG